MLAIVKKVEDYRKKEFCICSAAGYIPTAEQMVQEHLEEKEIVGSISLNGYCGKFPVRGKLRVNGCERSIELQTEKRKKWDGYFGKHCNGRCFDANGTERYKITEKLQVQGSFWLFKHGYHYYELFDCVNRRKYVIKNICFAADMHYYYIYDERESLVAAIYKPYRKPCRDEYHVYAIADEQAEGIYFFITYIDFFSYPYGAGCMLDEQEYQKLCEDDEAYHISCEELLQLYDEGFTREVIECTDSRRA